MGLAIRATAARCLAEVTFDRASFDSLARAEGRPLVLVPSHRSYGDFLLWSYLFFTHPELGIRLPRIAAAEEFGRIPVVGRILEACGAFYIRRGLGREDPVLSRRVREVIDGGETLQFFIEGRRSRSGQFLAPRRGILRALQATGRPMTVLPLAISYDRVPEESALLGELRSGKKAPMGFRRILGWLAAARRGEIALGRIHLSAGRPLELDARTDIERLGRDIMASLQEATAVSTHALAAFLGRHPSAPFDLAWLRRQLELRGAHVIESGLPAAEAARVGADAERQLRYGWEHWFHADALEELSGHPVVRHHVVRNGFAAARPAGAARDGKLKALVRLLVEPLLEDYRRVASLAGELLRSERRLTVPRLVARDASLHPATVEDALAALAGRYILAEAPGGGWTRGPHWEALGAFEAACEPAAAKRTPLTDGDQDDEYRGKIPHQRSHGLSRPAPAPGHLH
jgi:1-acyl-sn-glycerol-3-phosphate acyltransferase